MDIDLLANLKSSSHYLISANGGGIEWFDLRPARPAQLTSQAEKSNPQNQKPDRWIFFGWAGNELGSGPVSPRPAGPMASSAAKRLVAGNL